MVKSISKRFRLQKYFISTFLILFSVEASGQDTRSFWSPYSELNWENIGHYDSEFHTHPGLGGEEYDPHQTVDRYHEEGYTILALAAHDYDIPDDYMDSIYPWTQLSDIYEAIKHVANPTEEYQTYEQLHNEPWQNRDPIELGMVSVEANEVSAPHHTVSVFNSMTSGKSTEAESFEAIKELGGFAYLAHPGRYVERWGLTAHWYVDKYLRFDMLIGQSIYNRIDNHPEDRAFYDKIQHLLGGINRPIWLYGEDDMHHEGTLGWNRDVILLENFRPGSLHPDISDGSAPNVMEALQNGYSYLWKPSEQYNKRAFNITNIEIGERLVEITVDNPSEVDEVRWRTHNPLIDDTETVHYGYSISMDNVPDYSLFVRIEMEGPEGTIYTQPFYIESSN
ncbi:MAG: hypothetical protein EA391_13455 [Balneolaceae bacterium]|nr:MAG: hypothetical protein EA391_13455 [Balneolaceae bacterium]